MQGVQQVSVPHSASRQQIVRLAWLVICLATLLFCVLLGSSGYGLWRYRTFAMDMQGGTLIARSPIEWITWKRRDRSTFERPLAEQTLSEGDQVRINPFAGYGQAATIRLFDNNTLDMWAGADVRLAMLQTSRWNDREQIVILQQLDGYVRYDLPHILPYRQTTYRVIAGETTVDLSPGGSYSIEIIAPEGRVYLPGREPLVPVRVDVAVRAGFAEVYGAGERVLLAAGQRVEADPSGYPSLPVPARWELVQDGNFNTFSVEEYNNTTVPDQPSLPRANTWEVFSVVAEPGATPNGFFSLSQGCPPPQVNNECDRREWRNAAWFIRSGNQSRSFVTGVSQTFGFDDRGVDISEYRSLVFSAWVRILDQSIELTGERGTECPIMVRFLGKKDNPTDPEQQAVLCVYASTDETREPVRDPGLQYQRIVPYEWHHVQLQLRHANWVPDFKYLRSVEVYANGHDYDSRITNISLIGSHYYYSSDSVR